MKDARQVARDVDIVKRYDPKHVARDMNAGREYHPDSVRTNFRFISFQLEPYVMFRVPENKLVA